MDQKEKAKKLAEKLIEHNKKYGFPTKPKKAKDKK